MTSEEGLCQQKMSHLSHIKRADPTTLSKEAFNRRPEDPVVATHTNSSNARVKGCAPHLVKAYWTMPGLGWSNLNKAFQNVR